jgi:hypothetical protein
MPERFVKAIRARDIRVGDVQEDGRKVVSVSTVRDWTTLKFEGGQACSCSSDTLLEIIYRPYPEGKTEADMLGDVRCLTGCVYSLCEAFRLEPTPRRYVRLTQHITELRETLEALELGKPIDNSK